MNIVCPTITAENPHIYRDQIERVSKFANHLHLDLMDGEFTTNKSIDLQQLWMPDNITCDIHVMFKNPASALDEVSKLSARTFIVPAESEDDFAMLANNVKDKNMYFGVAILAGTTVESVKKVIALADHVLIFSGNLGHQGGSTADLSLLSKVKEIKQINPTAEIGWDGGINADNVAKIAEAGVTVFNSGGYIQFASNPSEAYQTLVQLVSKA